MSTYTIKILSEYQLQKLKEAFTDKNIHKLAIVLDTSDIVIEYTDGSGPNEWEGIMNTMAISASKENSATNKPGWQYGDEISPC